MSRLRFCVVLAFALAGTCVCFAQQITPEKALLRARGMYYTPTARGLQGFTCNVDVDWKSLLTRARGKAVADDDPLLRYLLTVRLSVTDDLRAGGNLGWAASGVPATEVETQASRLRQGATQMVHGFFQTWNGFMNGTVVPVPDASTTVEAQGGGYRLHATQGQTVLDQGFDANWVLTSLHVTTPALDVLMAPHYDQKDEGLTIASVKAVVHQPPTAPPLEFTMAVRYSAVGGFQLPSQLHFDEGNLGVFDYDLSGCAARTTAQGEAPAAVQH